jgi:hypothetical protein
MQKSAQPRLTVPIRPSLDHALSFAQRLGQPMHHSVLLHNARTQGLREADDFTQLAFQRGCRYYMPSDWKPSRQLSASLSPEALAIALLHPCLPYDPQRIRIAAAMVSAPDLKPQHLAHLAMQERAADVLRFIAEAGHRCEPDHSFWSELLPHLPQSRAPLPLGVMPHPSRFTAMTGRLGPGQRELKQTWIRPVAV